MDTERFGGCCRSTGKRTLEPKDILTNVFTATISLAGLLLVFVGFMYSQASSFPSDTDRRITNRFKRVAKFGLLPFAFALVVASCAFLEMLSGTRGSLQLLETLFMIELGAVLLYGGVSVLLYLG